MSVKADCLHRCNTQLRVMSYHMHYCARNHGPFGMYLQSKQIIAINTADIRTTDLAEVTDCNTCSNTPDSFAKHGVCKTVGTSGSGSECYFACLLSSALPAMHAQS